MNVVRVAHINRYGHPRIRQRQCFNLCLSQLSPEMIHRLGCNSAVTSQLRKDEGEVALFKLLPPIFDQQGEQGPVLHCPAGIALALVP
ncbi:hypothetical protein D3C87_1716490 [compost metagenome]